ncbi:MAG: hypothetical protein J0I01_11665 [Stenotrophomonas nitritireducens]|uniref:hypothetical protein n=1 Tax=Stenotrophomonas nitritireducens TaxID=83617 RepID=UPI001AC11AD7|nr:hypothetical protein [Stenotrophomonas nitritireducens]MBN8792876.1 hypothetical protein [Stenotrophomonas nitritireducens]
MLSLGHVSLHEQRGAFSTAEWLVKVARSCEAGVKALLSSFSFGFVPVLWLLSFVLKSWSNG